MISLNRQFNILGLAGAFVLSARVPVHAQAPVPSAARFDSTSTRPEAQVYRAWQEYYESKGKNLQMGAGTPSRLWVADEQAKWPMYDLAGYYVPDGAVPEIASISPLRKGQGLDYEIVVRFITPTNGDSTSKRSVALTATWHVRQQSGQWLVANALPARTRSWQTVTVGQITYHVEPGITFDHARALQAVTFVDSLANAFTVPRLTKLDYYVTATVDAALLALGVEYPRRFGPGGGFAKPVNNQLFAAVPLWGENYRHELTHLVLRPLLDGSTMTLLASEGIATWLGGSAGMERPEAIRRLRDYLVGHPGTNLDAAMMPGRLPQAELYAAGAVLCEMLFRRGGNNDLKAFLAAGPGADQLKRALAELLGLPWNEIVAEWRRTVDAMAGESK